MPRKKKDKHVDYEPGMMRREKLELDLINGEPGFDGTLDGMALIVSPAEEPFNDARQRVIELLRGEHDVAKFVETWDHVAKRSKPTLDDVAAKCGLNKSTIVGAITRVLYEWNINAARMTVSSICARHAAPVTTAMVAAAQSVDNGHQDRKLFMTAMRQVEKTAGKGTTINVKAEANNSTVNADEAVVVIGTRELPSFEEGTKRMAAALRRLPAAPVQE